MTPKLLKLAALALFISAAPAFASDDGRHCGEVAKTANWLTQEGVRAKLASTGFDVRHVKPKNGCYKVKAYDMLGALTEFYVDPVTAEFVSAEDQGGL